MGEPPKIRPNANGLLNRLAGDRTTNTTPDSLPVEQEERYAKWWEMRLLGASIPDICKHEKKGGKDFSEKNVIHGLDVYSSICMDTPGRHRRMAQHRAFVDKLRQIAMGQVQQLRKDFIDSGGKGIPLHTEERSFDEQKREIGSKEKITYEQVDRSMVPWLRFAVELDKYTATIDGLMGDLDQDVDLNTIEINMEGFIGLEESE